MDITAIPINCLLRCFLAFLMIWSGCMSGGTFFCLFHIWLNWSFSMDLKILEAFVNLCWRTNFFNHSVWSPRLTGWSNKLVRISFVIHFKSIFLILLKRVLNAPWAIPSVSAMVAWGTSSSSSRMIALFFWVSWLMQWYIFSIRTSCFSFSVPAESVTIILSLIWEYFFDFLMQLIFYHEFQFLNVLVFYIYLLVLII